MLVKVYDDGDESVYVNTSCVEAVERDRKGAVEWEVETFSKRVMMDAEGAKRLMDALGIGGDAS